MTISINQPTAMYSLADIFIRLMKMTAAPEENVVGRDREREFVDTVGRYGNVINKVCYAYARSREDFNDLRQDVMINIWRGMDSFRGDSSRQTWIYRVALNTCVSTLRKNRGNSMTVPIELIADDTVDSQSGEKERIEELHALISLLDPEEKAIMLMRLDDFKYEEIAEVMGLHRNTIATRIHRIKEKLTKMAKEERI